MPIESARPVSADGLPPLVRFLQSRQRQLGLSRESIATQFGPSSLAPASRSNVYGWFTGERRPGPRQMVELARTLDVDAETLVALERLAVTRYGGPAALGRALSAWPHMIHGHRRTVFLGGLTNYTGVVQLRALGDCSETLISVTSASPRLLAHYESLHNSQGRATAWLRASWLAMVDLLLDLSERPDRPHIRLWLRDEPAICPGLTGTQMAGTDWLMIDSDQPDMSEFTVHVHGDPTWPPIEEMYAAMRGADEFGPNRILYDSRWPDADVRRRAFSAFCGDVVEQIRAVVR